MTASEAFAAYQSAEAVWQAALVAAYGADAGDARYQVRGSMVEGYAEYCKARDAFLLTLGFSESEAPDKHMVWTARRDDARAAS